MVARDLKCQAYSIRGASASINKTIVQFGQLTVVLPRRYGEPLGAFVYPR